MVNKPLARGFAARPYLSRLRGRSTRKARRVGECLNRHRRLRTGVPRACCFGPSRARLRAALRASLPGEAASCTVLRCPPPPLCAPGRRVVRSSRPYSRKPLPVALDGGRHVLSSSENDWIVGRRRSSAAVAGAAPWPSTRHGGVACAGPLGGGARHRRHQPCALRMRPPRPHRAVDARHHLLGNRTVRVCQHAGAALTNPDRRWPSACHLKHPNSFFHPTGLSNGISGPLRCIGTCRDQPANLSGIHPGPSAEARAHCRRGNIETQIEQR